MNILILERMDHSGAGYALMQAVNGHTEHKARQATYEVSYLDYPVDILQPSRNQVRELWEWADVVNVHDGDDTLIPLPAPDRPMVTTYHGSAYRANWPYYNLFDRAMYRIPTALNLDLCMFGPRWLPRPQPDLLHLRDRGNGVFRVGHAPTNRWGKSTKEVLEAVDGLQGIEFDLIEHVSNAECLRRKARCHLMLEEFMFGYGTNALENWAMGIPVLADAYNSIKSFMRLKLGRLPFVETPLAELRQRIIEMRDNRIAYETAREQGRAYWEQHHRPEVVAERFIEICREAQAALAALEG